MQIGAITIAGRIVIDLSEIQSIRGKVGPVGKLQITQPVGHGAGLRVYRNNRSHRRVTKLCRRQWMIDVNRKATLRAKQIKRSAIFQHLR